MEEKDCALVIEVHEESSAGALISITKQLFVGCNFFNNSNTFVSKDGFTLVSAYVPDNKSNGIFVRGASKEEDTNKFYIPTFYLSSLRKAVDEYNEAMYNSIQQNSLEQKAIKTVASTLFNYTNSLAEELISIGDVLATAENVASLHDTKRRLLLTLTDLPVDVSECIYCQIYGSDCAKCPYGVDHGICANLDSNYQKMREELRVLRNSIKEY